MICKRCKNSFYGQAFITTECKICNTKIITGHIPGHRACKECAEKNNICEQCEEKVEE